MNQKTADALINNGFVESLCSQSDVIIIADTLPDARPVLQSLVSKKSQYKCTSWVVVELTTRFDWKVIDTDSYYSLVRRLFRKQPSKLIWVANNYFEAAYMKLKIPNAPDLQVIRPLGEWFIKDSNASFSTDASKVAIIQSGISSRLLKLANGLVEIPKRYGGPLTLLKFKGFLEIPYQASTMKFFENFAYGVPMIYPTPKFLKALNKQFNNLLVPDLMKTLLKLPRRMIKDSRFPEYHWSSYMDYYSPEFSNYIYYFDSLEDLKSLLMDDFDVKNVRITAPDMYQILRENSLRSWKNLLENCLNNK